MYFKYQIYAHFDRLAYIYSYSLFAQYLVFIPLLPIFINN
jgi:hypothetical protein